MRAGSSVALSGGTGGLAAVSLDPIVRPFIEWAAAALTARGVPADDAFVHAATGLFVVGVGAFGAWLRMRVIAAEDQIETRRRGGHGDGAVPGSGGLVGLLLVVALLGLGGCGARSAAPAVSPEMRELLDADRQSFALAEVSRVIDGLSRTHINLEAEGRIDPADDLMLSLALSYVTRQAKDAVSALNETGKTVSIRLRDLDQALASVWAWIADRVTPLPDGAARAELKSEAGPLVSLLETLRIEVTW